MEMCALSYFPCYNYQSEAVRKALAAGKDENSAAALMPSVMEQIAEVKLLHIPKALTNNVSPWRRQCIDILSLIDYAISMLF